MTQGQATPSTAWGQQPTNSALPTTFDAFDLQTAMVYDTNDRKRQAAEQAKQQLHQLSPLAGRLGNEVTVLVKSSLDHDEKIRRITAMREIATGQSAAVLHGFTDADAYKRLQESDKLSAGIKRALDRLLNDTDTEYIKVSEDQDNLGTPQELLDARDRINQLSSKLDNYTSYVDGPIREMLDLFAAVLGLGPVDDELTEDLRARIEVAVTNGAQPTNQIPAPQPAPPAGSNPQPAPTQPPAPGTQQGTPEKGRLGKAIDAIKGK